MADGYLEKKFEEFSKPKPIVKHVSKSLDSLLLKNRSYRGYNKQFEVSYEMLKLIVGVNTKIPSAKNQQVLRFKLITKGIEANKVLKNIKLGAMLPDLHLPFEGTEPEAFIIICSTAPETKMVDIDLGISAQSMLLKAVEMGLNGIIICAFNKEIIKTEINLSHEPLMIIAIGKGAEIIQLTEIPENGNRAYYRKDNIHFVPKVEVDALLL